MVAYSISEVSEDTFIVQWALAEDELPTPELAALIGHLARTLLARHVDWVTNVVPAYQTLLVQYNLLCTNKKTLIEHVDHYLQNWTHSRHEQSGAGELHQIPVYYHPDVAADLVTFCAEKSLTLEAVIRQHTEAVYSVYAVGFLPGFAYLGFVDQSIAMPRHNSFNARVPAGSVGIADRQTAVYPSDSPGGWQIIGRTPTPMISNGRSLLQVGDRVQFIALSRDGYRDLGGKFA